MMLPGYVATQVGTSPSGSSEAQHAEARQHQGDDTHLRDCKTVMAYRVEATDGEIGHVEGFLVDDETWAIRYIIVNTSNWWMGHKVLIAPQWIDDVNWDDATVAVNVTQQAVKDAPPYDSATRLDRESEVSLYKHHGRPGHWVAGQDNHETTPTVL